MHEDRHSRRHSRRHATAVVMTSVAKCPACQAAALLLCSNCRTMRYCSKECQQEHWKTHKEECRKKAAQNTARQAEMLAHFALLRHESVAWAAAQRGRSVDEQRSSMLAGLYEHGTKEMPAPETQEFAEACAIWFRDCASMMHMRNMEQWKQHCTMVYNAARRKYARAPTQQEYLLLWAKYLKKWSP